MPLHVAVIMDGNGRWARRRLLNRIRGHEAGAETVRRIVRASREVGLAYLTLYAFSTENWQRPNAEVNALMGLLERFLDGEQAQLMENNIRLRAIGQTGRLPGGVKAALERVTSATSANDGMTLILALSYGGRDEIVTMAKNLAQEAAAGRLDADRIDARTVADRLETAGIPDPDLLIRTSGEMRISNFLLWQIAYAEIFFTDTLWPDFSRQEFLSILSAYQRRERRFGRV
ncbi:MAG TPA: isoprenyl transferase [Desulfobacteraceae bacterium]|nr:isoprenyl transferase [Deltaproteobacteria bacterium]HDI60168.1 isoprenyl transferase [Desulfobacteraceae bacterium]